MESDGESDAGMNDGVRNAPPKAFLDWRGVENPCGSCRGSGVRIYSSGSTWRGGMGTSGMTRDVCDVCWGTGDERRRGIDLRALMSREDERVAKRAGELFAKRVGFSFRHLAPAIAAAASELERLSAARRGRDARPECFDQVCSSLAGLLREVGAASGGAT